MKFRANIQGACYYVQTAAGQQTIMAAAVHRHDIHGYCSPDRRHAIGPLLGA
jgi:hypothetical protein